MKWFLVGNYHINVDRLNSFWYDQDEDRLVLSDCEGVHWISDPDRSLYKKLCLNLGQEPAFGWEPLEKYGE